MINKENNILNKFLIHIRVNGRDYEELIEPDMTLLNFIRYRLGLTGTKQGCDTTNCGACTVIMDGMAIKSCNTLAVQADGHEIQTIEGLLTTENGVEKLHPLQQAFMDHGAVQCGFCTSGMIMSAKALLDKYPDSDEDDIREAMHGNICRCTGYVKIVEAIEAARDVMREDKKS